MADFQDLVNKVLTDDKFRKDLIANPEKTLRAMGVEPTPEMLDALKDVDEESLKALANRFFDDEDAAR